PPAVGRDASPHRVRGGPPPIGQAHPSVGQPDHAGRVAGAEVGGGYRVELPRLTVVQRAIRLDPRLRVVTATNRREHFFRAEPHRRRHDRVALRLVGAPAAELPAPPPVPAPAARPPPPPPL